MECFLFFTYEWIDSVNWFLLMVIIDRGLFLFVVETDFSKISFAFLFKFERVNKAMWKPGGLWDTQTAISCLLGTFPMMWINLNLKTFSKVSWLLCCPLRGWGLQPWAWSTEHSNVWPKNLAFLLQAMAMLLNSASTVVESSPILGLWCLMILSQFRRSLATG